MVPPAPGRLSTTAGWPSRLGRCSARMRATTSLEPPGGKVTTIFTALFGQAWARTAQGARPRAPVAEASCNRRRRVGRGVVMGRSWQRSV